MGLLDDAIREHLELKRQHGGDPSEIERQEQEAFGPGGRRTAPVEDAPAPADDATDDAAEPLDEDATVVQPPPDDDAPAAIAASTEEEAIDPPPDAGRDEDAPGHDEDPWLVEETADPDLDAESQEEDVLEETPDFLQETPEHDRLWFEQKPPRDFDWDK
jgi:hypothetical protein